MRQTRTATTATQTATTNIKGAWDGMERRRVEKVVETLATLRSRGENIAEVAHDARNMVTALTLYCELLEAPGVLAKPFAHYAQELGLVAAASRRLVEKLVTLNAGIDPGASAGAARDLGGASLGEANAGRPAICRGDAQAHRAAANASAPGVTPWPAAGASKYESSGRAAMPNPAGPEIQIDERVEECAGGRTGEGMRERNRPRDLLSALPIANLAAELQANRNLLAALAGPSVALTMDTEGGAQAVRLTAEDLTRLLVNLVKNASEAMLVKNASEAVQANGAAMPKGGRIAVGLREVKTAKGAAPCLALTIEDNGPGIPEEDTEKIFVSGYTSRSKATAAGGWPQTHRGLGLAIVRSIVEGAGGRISAENRPQGGACFTLELPVARWGTGIGS